MKNREWKKKDKAKGKKIQHKKSALKNNEVGKKASKSYCKTQVWKFKMKKVYKINGNFMKGNNVK